MDMKNLGGSTSASKANADMGSQSAASAEGFLRPSVVRLSDVAPEQVRWLWPGYIAYRKLSLVVGDPGIGKSQLTLDLAARVTTGKDLPVDGGPVAQGDVLVLTAEDGVADTVRPRVDAAHGDPCRVHIFKGIVAPNGTTVPPSFPAHLQWLRDTIKVTKARVVIIDPLSAHLDCHINSWSDHDVRRALAPLAQLAEETGVALIVVMHLNKDAKKGAMYRAGGSIAFVAAARIVHLAARDPDNDNLCVLAPLKSNVGPLARPLAYKIVPCGPSASRVDWRGVSEHDADTLLAEQARSGEKQAKLKDAKEFLQEFLAHGRRPKDQVLTEGLKLGHKPRTLDRAFKKLGGCSTKEFGGPAHWELPAYPANPPDIDHTGEVPVVETPNSSSGSEDANSANLVVVGVDDPQRLPIAHSMTDPELKRATGGL